MEHRPIPDCPGFAVFPWGEVIRCAIERVAKNGETKVTPARVLDQCGRGKAYVALRRADGSQWQASPQTLVEMVWGDRPRSLISDAVVVTLSEYRTMLAGRRASPAG